MKKLIATLVLVAAMAPVASAAGAGLGFDIFGTLYTPSDSRFQGIGTGVTLNIKVDDNLTVGYRAREIELRFEDGDESYNSTMRSHGIIAMYKAFSLDKMSIEGGLFVGNGRDANLYISTPVIEPMARLVYTTVGKIDTRIFVGVGYSFARGAHTDSGIGESDKPLDNMD
ncbi:MAG: hypothetical protein NTW04_02235, partial [Elusimicrobia bacterium]|nr:hypothetical protein [Elusimicrobiota bacterium]